MEANAIRRGSGSPQWGSGKGMIFSAISLQVGGSESHPLREHRFVRIRKTLLCYFSLEATSIKTVSPA
jgi:hypothetical protein